MKTHTVKVTWTWTNWTFGFWSARIGGRRMAGIDVGPYEAVWEK